MVDDPINPKGKPHRGPAAWADCAGRYRKALLLRAAYGAATASGTTAVGLMVFLIRRTL